MAIISGVEKTAIAGYAGLFLLNRIVYTGIYLSSFNGLLRTGTFAVGLIFGFAMMVTTASVYEYGA
jgi:uncharacterized MAPEG superfamily protein